MEDVVIGRGGKVSVEETCGEGRCKGCGGSESGFVGFVNGGGKFVEALVRDGGWRLGIIIVVGEDVDFESRCGGNREVGEDVADGSFDKGVGGGTGESAE